MYFKICDLFEYNNLIKGIKQSCFDKLILVHTFKTFHKKDIIRCTHSILVYLWTTYSILVLSKRCYQFTNYFFLSAINVMLESNKSDLTFYKSNTQRWGFCSYCTSY